MDFCPDIYNIEYSQTAGHTVVMYKPEIQVLGWLIYTKKIKELYALFAFGNNNFSLSFAPLLHVIWWCWLSCFDILNL